jgi:hypothetical protein
MLQGGNRWMVTVGLPGTFALVPNGYHPYLFTAHPSSALDSAARGGNRQVVTVRVPTRRDRGGAR